MDKDSWEKGYQAGLSLCPDKPEGVEVLSWYSGYIEGEAAAREIEKQRSLTDPNFNIKVKIRGWALAEIRRTGR